MEDVAALQREHPVGEREHQVQVVFHDQDGDLTPQPVEQIDVQQYEK